MKVVVLASGAFAVPTLEALADGRHTLVGIISRPDAPRGRGRRLGPCPAAAWAASRGVTLLQPKRVSDPDFEGPFRGLGADVAVVADFGEILKPFVLAWVPEGFFGLHPSLLPRWRGPAPIPWAILAGDSRTGVSVFKVDPSVDAGSVVLRREEPIRDRDTASSLEERLAGLAARVLLDVLDLLEGGSLVPTPQPAEEATFARKLTRKDGLLRWEEEARVLDRIVRACTPWPRGWFPSARGEVTVLRATPMASTHRERPGTYLGIGTTPEGEEGLRIACGEGELLLLELQSPGKRPLPGAAWVRGARMVPGAHVGGGVLS